MKTDTLKLPEGTKVPNHIAMILDGNRRWARARGLQPWEGHKAGYLAIKRAAEASRQLGVHTFTVWSFSTENWDRPEEEIREIFKLLKVALNEVRSQLFEEKVALVHLGRKDRIPKELMADMTKLEQETWQFRDHHVFNVALDYGGRDEIIRAVNKVIKGLRDEEIEEKDFDKYLDTAGQPYPYVDLFIRTSGEQRTSGLMPWQMTYAEMYWEVDHLPDFTPAKLGEAILDYSRRRRRFGGNDAEEHLKFDPGLVANFELKMARSGDFDGMRFRDLLADYLKEQYGMSKELAKTAGGHLLLALQKREKKDWDEAKGALKELYGLVRKNLGLAFEPEIVANFEVKFWQDPTEVNMRDLLAEKYRVSSFQAAKSAHLAVLAQDEVKKGNWDQAKKFFEKYYLALKERVA